jgi:hypothetical protein
VVGFPTRTRDFALFRNVQTGSEAHQPPIHWVPRFLTPTGREARHSPAFSFKVKSHWSYNSTLSICHCGVGIKINVHTYTHTYIHLATSLIRLTGARQITEHSNMFMFYVPLNKRTSLCAEEMAILSELETLLLVKINR